MQGAYSPDVLQQHNVILRRGQVALRPLTENDWDILLRWNSDPEVLYYSDGDDVEGYGLSQVQTIYRTVSQNAYCFMIEFAGEPIGECWLQRMNLERILIRYPGLDCRRIDLMIGEKRFQGRGIGTEVIRILAKFGFWQDGAEVIFGCDIADYNLASLRAFAKVGFSVDAERDEPSGRKARRVFDLRLTKQQLACDDPRVIRGGSETAMQ
jgi:aminoglycoside 6'-N-acetyltransferase